MKRVLVVFGVVMSMPASAQCTKDIECKGDRICSQGVCVNPAPAVDLTPAPRTAERPQLLDPTEPPPSRFEVGRMLAESGVGVLIAAAVSILPYFYFFNGPNLFASGDDPYSSLMLVAIFAAVPFATAPTELAIANGSRAFRSDFWPELVAGIASQAIVLGLYYATGWLPKVVDSVTGTPRKGASCSTDMNTGLQTCGGSLPLLLVGTIAAVPLIEMAVINIFKQPMRHVNEGVGPRKPGLGVIWQPPSAAPILTASDGSKASGVQFSLLRGAW